MSQAALDAVMACMNRDEVSIELDCAPGSPRPGDLLPAVLDGTGIQLDPNKPDSAFFGNWKWVIPAEQHEQYATVKELIRNRIMDLYHLGRIRYGSW